MGMFDDIRYSGALPDGITGEDCESSFQSKDLECALTQYEIREDGRLWFLAFELVARQRGPDMPGESPFERRNERWLDSEYHGMLRFYGNDRHGAWHEYVAKFTDGNLVEIVTADDWSTPATTPEASPRSVSSRSRLAEEEGTR